MFHAIIKNLPVEAEMKFILEFSEDGSRRELDYIKCEDKYKVYYCLYIPGTYHILFNVNGMAEVEVRVRGEGM